MAISGKYGKIAVPHIKEQEPIFILRAQDLLAGPTLEIYEILARSQGAALAGGLKKEIGRFRRWPGPKKLPD